MGKGLDGYTKDDAARILDKELDMGPGLYAESFFSIIQLFAA